MNKYPLIHSISTVGVIKHFNQDYLLHHTRTDFTGDNGIGKSLIADLLQILFIADNKKIAFGTDSFKKEDRQVFTIPYKTSDAYFFVNIEITSKQYFTLGVNIPNTSSSPIRMFRVLNNYYSSEGEAKKSIAERKKLTGYLIPEEKLLYHKDFLISKNNKTEIPKISDLVSHLRDTKGLILNYFSTKSERKELYQFLYDKEILSLNLSIDNHLNAFAKVLQAFSKANTLNTEKDKSLKNFLFDDKKEEIEIEYKRNKERLDNLVIRYGRLRKLTDDLKEKRTYLEDLSKKEEEFIVSEKLAFKKEYHEKLLEQQAKTKKWDKDEKKYKELFGDIKKLKEKLPSLQKEKEITETIYTNYLKSLQKLTSYKEKFNKYLEEKEEIEKLKKIELPNVSKEPDLTFVFGDVKINQVILEIEKLKPIWNDYGSILNIEEQYKKQSIQSDKLKQNLNEELNRLKLVLQLVNYTNEETLAHQIIKNKKALSKAQETILINLFLNVKWEKPTNVSDNLVYTKSLDLIDESNIFEDTANNGYWVTVGHLNYFTNYSKEEQIFNDVNNIKKAFNKKEQEISTALKKLRTRINYVENLEIDNILQHIPDIDFKWDKRIPDRRKIEEYREIVSLIKNLKKFKDSLRNKQTFKEKELEILKNNIPFKFSGNKIHEIIEEQSKQLETLNVNKTEAFGLFIKSKTELEGKEKSLSELEFDVDEIKIERENFKKSLKDIKKEKEKKYPELFVDFNLNEFKSLNLHDIKNNYPLKKSAYRLRYQDVLKDFPNTNDDIEVKEQIENKTYNFRLLERKLLSNTNIDETKNIEQALNSANEEKRKMSSTLREIMLKIFQKTQNEFEAYKSDTARLNLFFKNKLISDKYYFQVRFNINSNFSIQWINELQSNAQTAGGTGELFESESVEQFVENFFKDVSGYGKGIAFSELLDPQTYFSLKTEFKDEEGNEYPGSTGESYTARVLLGIGRLSIASKEQRKGLRFLILEEVASLDPSNFKTFPKLAERFGYQIITMTPKPYGSNSDEGWYLHQLIEGKVNKDINYPVPNSSFKTNYSNEQLLAYLERNKN
ncbi:hypothetical protein [Tenacibaculum maritimum]|uniref:hypothetical protein n=1 Tax=Tenacibaculum maritimum TaxID=107401 RepID=UPI0012E4E1DD|nr:hypothetical protein [Tenacibaculum maritimum]CAA0257949.1 conserved hypothetical protein [Tenacibaculum maritimum]